MSSLYHVPKPEIDGMLQMAFRFCLFQKCRRREIRNLCVLAAAVLFTELFPADTVFSRQLSDVELLLAGIFINGVESGNVDGYHRSRREFWLSLEDLQRATGLEATGQGDTLLFKTPIGRAELAWDEVWLLDGRAYLSFSQLWQLLRIKATFDQARYGFMLDVPWRPGSLFYDEKKIREARMARIPDVEAPDSSLGFLRLRSDYDRQFDDGKDTWVNTLDSGGALGKGTWLLGLRQQDEDEIRLNRYFWNRVLEKNAFRVGTSYIDLGLLLDSFYYTGIQWAYSNRDISSYTDFATDLNFDSFLRDDLDVQRDIIRDDGPAGGIAELRINNTPVARVRVNLNGHYEFRNIPVRKGSFQLTQVYLYQRTLNDPPKIINLTRSAIRQMLASGEWLLRAGAGESGNSLYDDYGTPSKGNASGFLLARHGMSDTLTFQGVVQYNAEQGREAMLGFRLGLGQNWAWALDVSDREGKSGLSSELEGTAENWDFRLRSNWYGQEYRSNLPASSYDNYLRTFYGWSESLRIGLVGRYSRDTHETETTFLKPGMYWYPLTGFTISGEPNLDGEYRVRACWYMNPLSRLSATYENNRYNLAYDYHHEGRIFSQSGFDYDQDQDEQRIYTSLGWYLDDNRYNYLQGGLSHNGESAGYFISWNRMFTPGIELKLELQDKYRTFPLDDNENGFRVFASLRIDLGISGSQLVPTDNRRINFSRGGISGFLRDQKGNRIEVEGVAVRVNGRRLPQYQAGGAFYVGNLSPGIYELEIDEAKLPIEYVPIKKRYLVEVVRAAVTTVNFIMQARYGFSGKVTTQENTPVANALLQVVNESGEKVAEARSGRFGYYRTNALKPGVYRVRVIKIDKQPLPEPYREIQVEIKDDYLFGQDIQLQTSGHW